MLKIHIVYISDINYEMATCVSIVSLKLNRQKAVDYVVHVLVEEISEKGKDKILSLSETGFEIYIIDVYNNNFKELAQRCLIKETHVTKTAMYKFYIDSILGDEIDKVLYLDGDILINKDISELFELDLSDVYVAAVEDMGDEHFGNGESVTAARIGLKVTSYFNSGMMLLNLEKMRIDNIGEKLVRYRTEQTNYFMDQDAFNYIMHKNWIKLPYVYNFRTALFDSLSIEEISDRFYKKRYIDYESCLKDQYIIHMSANLKPWIYYFPWVTDLFLKYYSKSPYRNLPIYFSSPLKIINEQNKWIYKENQGLHKRLGEKIWGFPFSKIKKGSNIILYGAGEVGHDFYKQIIESEFCQIAIWVDKDFLNKSENVSDPEKIKECEFDYIVIAILKEKCVREVIEYLETMNIDKEKIVILN